MHLAQSNVEWLENVSDGLGLEFIESKQQQDLLEQFAVHE